jgi:HPP family
VNRSSIYAPLAAVIIIALIGLLALLTRQLWLFPSLGPTIFIQVVTPNHVSARAWSTLAGHVVGIAAGFGAVFLVGAQHSPPVLSSGDLTIERVVATALAIGVTVSVQEALRAPHPPAAATTMLLTLGAMQPNGATALALLVGVGLVTGLGELGRRMHPESPAR